MPDTQGYGSAVEIKPDPDALQKKSSDPVLKSSRILDVHISHTNIWLLHI